MRQKNFSRIFAPGFTLIELLVVIAIIGILSTLAIMALGSARQKARDSKRVADLNQIGKALELYFSDNNAYPTIITIGAALLSPDGNTTYLSKIPGSPSPKNDGSCPNSDYQYSYITGTNTYIVGSCISTPQGAFSAGPIGYSSGSGLQNCGGNIQDSDGNIYGTIQIGSQCWMRHNINVGTTVLCNGAGGTSCATTPSNDNAIEKWCYNNTTSYCTTYGGFYSWAEAMQLPAICDSTDCSAQVQTPHRGICPSGFHIPTDTEYKNLEVFLGMTWAQANGTGYRGTDQGAQMRPTGSSGFASLYAGYQDPTASFTGLGVYGTLGTATQGSSTTAYVRIVHGTFNDEYRNTYGKTGGKVIRCLKD